MTFLNFLFPKYQSDGTFEVHLVLLTVPEPSYPEENRHTEAKWFAQVSAKRNWNSILLSAVLQIHTQGINLPKWWATGIVCGFVTINERQITVDLFDQMKAAREGLGF